MSNHLNDGGPAFPCPPSQHSNGFYSTGNGMTLRDYFAAAALQGICASGPSKEWPCIMLANESYQLADAMIRAREVKP